MKYIYIDEETPVEVEASSRLNAVSKVYHILRDMSDRPEHVDYEDILDNTIMKPEGDCAYDSIIQERYA